MRNERALFSQKIITAAKELANAAKEKINQASPELREKLLSDAERNAYVAEETFKQHGNSDDDASGLKL